LSKSICKDIKSSTLNIKCDVSEKNCKIEGESRRSTRIDIPEISGEQK
jgi:hypothetical protein